MQNASSARVARFALSILVREERDSKPQPSVSSACGDAVRSRRFGSVGKAFRSSEAKPRAGGKNPVLRNGK